MAALRALIWDVDGTLAETERDGHRVAFNLAFAALGLPWQWDEGHYGRLLTVAGGRERLMHDLAGRADASVMLQDRVALVERIHALKNGFYAQLVAAGSVALRPGVRSMLEQCRAEGLRLGIVTTTRRRNLEALLAAQFGPGWAGWFDAVVCGEDVRTKKPDPEGYRRALALLRLPPLACAAVEDSPGGLAAARAADLPVIVTLSSYFSDAILDGAIAIGPGFHQRAGWRPALPGPAQGPVTLTDLRHWHAQMDMVSQSG
jgi:HAD superfamily hydrolase (TIGR01509 family)